MTQLSVLILAGGRGTRFWPLSRMRRPKQFLPLIAEDSLLQQTFERVAHLVPTENIFISTTEDLATMVREQLPQLRPDQIFAEPQARNTAPSLLWCTELIRQRLGDEVRVLCCPSDHYIPDHEQFVHDISSAVRSLNEIAPRLVTFGISPRFPHTGYGYIRAAVQKLAGSLYAVEEFVEKPSRSRAEEYIRDGNYFWNAGIFLWSAKYFVDECRKRLKGAPEFLKNPSCRFRANEVQKIDCSVYGLLEATSVDYALMEKSDHVALCRAGFEWNDLGSWSALLEQLPLDPAGNGFRGSSIVVDHGSNNLVVNEAKRVVCLLGTHNLVVIQTEDALLICDRNADQDVKELLKKVDPSLL